MQPTSPPKPHSPPKISRNAIHHFSNSPPLPLLTGTGAESCGTAVAAAAAAALTSSSGTSTNNMSGAELPGSAFVFSPSERVTSTNSTGAGSSEAQGANQCHNINIANAGLFGQSGPRSNMWVDSGHSATAFLQLMHASEKTGKQMHLRSAQNVGANLNTVGNTTNLNPNSKLSNHGSELGPPEEPIDSSSINDIISASKKSFHSGSLGASLIPSNASKGSNQGVLVNSDRPDSKSSNSPVPPFTQMTELKLQVSSQSDKIMKLESTVGELKLQLTTALNQLSQLASVCANHGTMLQTLQQQKLVAGMGANDSENAGAAGGGSGNSNLTHPNNTSLFYSDRIAGLNSTNT